MKKKIPYRTIVILWPQYIMADQYAGKDIIIFEGILRSRVIFLSYKFLFCCIIPLNTLTTSEFATKGFLTNTKYLSRPLEKNHWYNGQSEGMKTYFFALHLTLGGKLDIYGRDDLFFCASPDLGRKTDVMTFREPVLFLRCENTSGPAGMALSN